MPCLPRTLPRSVTAGTLKNACTLVNTLSQLSTTSAALLKTKFTMPGAWVRNTMCGIRALDRRSKCTRCVSF
eukprot:IDg16630t1